MGEIIEGPGYDTDAVDRFKALFCNRPGWEERGPVGPEPADFEYMPTFVGGDELHLDDINNPPLEIHRLHVQMVDDDPLTTELGLR